MGKKSTMKRATRRIGKLPAKTLSVKDASEVVGGKGCATGKHLDTVKLIVR